jgi:hypothetical protein
VNARPSTLATSSSMTFHTEPRFRRRVSHASGSISTTASWENPACSKPSVWPPAPAQISTDVSSIAITSPALTADSARRRR